MQLNYNSQKNLEKEVDYLHYLLFKISHKLTVNKIIGISPRIDK